MDIGFIGIGQMGQHMSRHILEAGYKLTVCDLNKEAAAQLIESGAKWADTPKEMATSCRVVITCLPTPQSVEQVVYGTNGLKSGWKSGDIYMDMSTNAPSLLRRIAEDARTMGVSVLDAPMSGGAIGAEKGTLAIMVGGDSASLEKVRKILECIGKSIFYVGDAGCGNVAKLVNNMISLACTTINAEGFVLGTKAGIAPQVLWEIVKASTGNNWSLQQYPDGVFKGNFEPGFRLSLAYKDIGLALDLGKEYSIPLPVGTAVREEISEAISAGFIDKNISSVIIPLENAAKIKVRSSK